MKEKNGVAMDSCVITGGYADGRKKRKIKREKQVREAAACKQEV